MKCLRLVFVLSIAGLLFSAFAQSGQTALTGDQIVDRVAPSVVLVLAGRGEGEVAALGSGVIVEPDGVILTANHLVKGMREVQVRLKSGDTYDRVELIAADERRDIAALRISATGLPAVLVAAPAEVRPGAPVYVVSHAVGLPWSASSGVLSATRLADEVPGAGSGYKLLQFTAPLSPGSSGGLLVDGQARPVGIVLGSMNTGQNVNFAVPVDSVAGLANAWGGVAFASGAKLRLPNSAAPASAETAPRATRPATDERPQNIAVSTLAVTSRTVYLRRERLQDDLKANALFNQLGLRFADYGQVPDVTITVDRPFLTFDWTYTLEHRAGMTLAAGSIIGDDEFDAGPKLAAEILQRLSLGKGTRAAQPAPAVGTAPARAASRPVSGGTPVDVLKTFKTIYVESKTIYLKGNLLQDALYVRPEMKQWGVQIVDDRGAADILVTINRPFLSFDWAYTMLDAKSGTTLANGKVVAWDGPIAAPQLAAEIVKHIRAVRD